MYGYHLRQPRRYAVERFTPASLLKESSYHRLSHCEIAGDNPVIDTYLNLRCPVTAAGLKRQGVGHFASPRSPQVEAQARPVHPIALWNPRRRNVFYAESSQELHGERL
jgi:hypothetical protein